MSFLPGQRSVQICWNYLLSYFCERVSFHESGRYTVAGGVELPEVILKDRVTPHEEESHPLCLILNGAQHHGEKCWVITSHLPARNHLEMNSTESFSNSRSLCCVRVGV